MSKKEAVLIARLNPNPAALSVFHHIAHGFNYISMEGNSVQIVYNCSTNDMLVLHLTVYKWFVTAQQIQPNTDTTHTKIYL